MTANLQFFRRLDSFVTPITLRDEFLINDN
jgi:hypothetical protein